MVKDRREIPTQNCQSCSRPDAAECEMVECDICKKWEHFGCAGVDQRIKQPDRRYKCKSCYAKQGAVSKPLPPFDDRPARSTRASTKKSQVASVTSSVRAAMMEAQLKIAEEELRHREQELVELAELKQRELEESERQLREKKQLAEEEKVFGNANCKRIRN